MSPRGVALLRKFEGFRSKAYQDIVGVWTIGYGFTDRVRPGDTITDVDAGIRLQRELRAYEAAVWNSTGGNVNQNQFDAMVSLAWNIGIDGFKRSTVLRAHNRGDHEAAARAFALWNKAGGKVIPGLTRRRAAEAEYYLDPVPDDVSDPVEGPALEMPQRVDPESTLTRSPIATAGTATAAVSTVSVVAQVAQEAKTIRDSIGDALPYVILLAAVAAIGFGVWTVIERVRQRKGGWA